MYLILKILAMYGETVFVREYIWWIIIPVAFLIWFFYNFTIYRSRINSCIRIAKKVNKQFKKYNKTKEDIGVNHWWEESKRATKIGTSSQMKRNSSLH